MATKSPVWYIRRWHLTIPPCDNHHDAINAALIRLQNCILELIKWMTSNTLKINEEKTEFTIFNRTNVSSSSYTLQISDNSTTMGHQVQILGVTLDSSMTLDSQIATPCRCRSSYMHIRRINTIRQYLINDGVKTLTQSLVTSRLNYCTSSITIYQWSQSKNCNWHKWQLLHL